MENDVSKVASIKRQDIRHARLHFFAAGYRSRYCIIEFTDKAQSFLQQSKMAAKNEISNFDAEKVRLGFKVQISGNVLAIKK